MKAILQAASAYYAVNSKWPTSLTDTNTDTNPDTNFANYLPYFKKDSDGNPENPWGAPLGLFEGAPSTDKLTFMVLATGLPNNETSARIAAQLPNGVNLGGPTAGPYTAQASVATPGGSTIRPTLEDPIIQKIGTIAIDVATPPTISVTCPVDRTPCIYALPSNFALTYYKKSPLLIGSLTVVPMQCKLSGDTDTGTNSTHTRQCTLQYDITGGKTPPPKSPPTYIIDGEPYITYIGVCQGKGIGGC